MEIKNSKLSFKSLQNRVKTDFIILHHRAGEGDVESIHKQHLKQDWSGIGYHFYVRKNGEIWQGRPIDCIGAHCPGKNSFSVGVCFEGNFEVEKMGDIQLNAGKELINFLHNKYPKASINGHKVFYSTACPGKNFPIEEYKRIY